MDDKRPKEVIHGYEIKESIVFENNRGFALAENPNAPGKFVTWQFTEEGNGKRDYYWGHYTSDGDAARRDYNSRFTEYVKDYGVTEKTYYRYYSTQRPVDIGTFPKDGNAPARIVNFDERENIERENYQAWGYLEYSAPLTKKQIDDYELKPSRFNPDTRAVMREQAQVVGAWEEKRATPGNIRLTMWETDGELFLPKYHITPAQLAERYNLAISAQTRKPRPIAEQLAEGAELAARDNAARPPTDKNTHKKENRD